MTEKSTQFIFSNKTEWENPSDGVFRQILGFNQSMMMVKVSFEKGAIGAPHTHPHSQASYVVSGKFEVEIEGKKELLSAGDGFFVEPNLTHGVVALEEGVLIDTFSPVRQDFL